MPSCKEHKSHICSFTNLGSLLIVTRENTLHRKPYGVPVKGC